MFNMLLWANFVVISIALLLGIVNGWARMFGFRGFNDEDTSKNGIKSQSTKIHDNKVQSLQVEKCNDEG